MQQEMMLMPFSNDVDVALAVRDQRISVYAGSYLR